MKSSKQILKEHYLALGRKAGAWLGVFSMLATAFVAAPASAVGTQMGARSATLSTAAANATPVTATFVFKPGSASTLVKAIRFQICTSPLETTACTAPTAGSMAAATAGTQTGTGVTNQYGSPAYTGATDVVFSNATGNTLTSSNSITFPVNVIHNPSALGSFYFRIITYTDASATAEVDYGAVAVSTAASVQVTANVQESLTFCVYTGANCAAGVTGAVALGTGADNVLSATVPSGGISKMEASTNATTGYVINYVASDLSSSNDTITAAGASATTFTGGTAKFGINLKANTTALTPGGALGSNVSGGSGVPIAPYATADQIAFVSGATPQTVANSASAPTATSTYVVTYAAQAGNTTKPGAFSTTFNWICTGTF